MVRTKRESVSVITGLAIDISTNWNNCQLEINYLEEVSQNELNTLSFFPIYGFKVQNGF